MTEEVPVSALAKTVKRAASKPKKTGPRLRDLIVKVLSESTSRGGMSLAGLKKGLKGLGYDTDKNKARIRITVRTLVDKEVLIQIKGTGASGSFRLNKKVDTKAKKAVAKKAPLKAKKVVAKKSPAAKKPATPAKKSAAAKKSAKKVKKAVAKSPKKAAKSPRKAAKSPKKAPVKKAPAKKAPAKKAPAKRVAKPKPSKKTASKKK
ncbi:histone H1-like [Paralichthys olivaceus]|uniref:histone H1-like n=1 Tax=Paralichthys olivaceus TaxID=8255 RepID=UPI00097DFD76|nr:PREDICTED: histone H1-like [Paralichthys olivaceus]